MRKENAVNVRTALALFCGYVQARGTRASAFSAMCFCAFVWQLTRGDGTTDLYRSVSSSSFSSSSLSLSRNFASRIRAYPLALARSPFSASHKTTSNEERNSFLPLSPNCKMRRFYFGRDLNKNGSTDLSSRERENLFIIIFILYTIDINAYIM